VRASTTRAEPGRLGRLSAKWWLGAVAATAVIVGGKRRALRCYDRIVALDPRDERARNTVGNLRMELGDAQGAVEAFQQLIGVNPRSATAWFNLGFIHDEHAENDAAERCFRAAVDIDPKLDRAWYGLGLVLIRQGRYGHAIKALKRNTALQPYSPYGWYQLAMTHHHLGQGAEAWRLHEHLKRFEPRYAATLKRDLEQTPPRTVRGHPPDPTRAAGKETLATTA
jgi:tetratricopeptide (TPR) repeat protein